MYKGDAISTQCYFDTKSSDVFGLGTNDEMCMTIFLYYPRQPNLFICGPDSGICSASHDSSALASEEDLGREFGYGNTESDTDPFDDTTPTSSAFSIDRNLGNSIWTTVLFLYLFGTYWIMD